MEDNLKKFEPKIVANPASNEVIEALELLLEKAKKGQCEGMAMVFIERGDKGSTHLIRTYETSKACHFMVGALFGLIQRLTE